MKIAIFGAGAVGGYFGVRLHQAGHDVTFIARGAHLEAMRHDGLRVESALGDVHLSSLDAVADPSEVGPVDLVLFLVKLQDTKAAARSLMPLLGADTGVASFQNGIDGWRLIGEAIGTGRVFGGSAYIFADVKAPGVIRHRGTLARLVFGELEGRRSKRVVSLAEALGDAGVDHEVVDDVHVRTWEKFVLLSATSGVTSLTRLSVGEILASDECAALLRDALEETTRVGKRECPALPADTGARQFAFARSLPAGMRSSMLDDLERGKPLELDFLSGTVARLGHRHGVETPVHETIFRALSPYARGRHPAA